MYSSVNVFANFSTGILECFHIGDGNGTPLHYSYLENPMDGGAWWVAVHGVAKSRTQLSDFTFIFHFHAPGCEGKLGVALESLQGLRDLT